MTVRGQEGTVAGPSGLSVRVACSPAKGTDDRAGMVVRNPAPDASPPRVTPGTYGTFTISR